MTTDPGVVIRPLEVPDLWPGNKALLLAMPLEG
jgi:hypothetical protein